MKKNPDSDLVGRISRRAVCCAFVGAALAFAFTRAFIYSIILLLAAAIAIVGFRMLAGTVDRLLRRGGGQARFFGLQLVKLMVITVTFIGVARLSEAAVLAYIAGISMVVIAGMIEGFQYFLRGLIRGA